MKVKFLLIYFAVIFSISFIVSNKDYASSVSVSILANVEALASECASSEVSGSAFTVTCDTPLNNKGGKCSYSVVTCQGSSNCCTRNYCSSHMN